MNIDLNNIDINECRIIFDCLIKSNILEKSNFNKHIRIPLKKNTKKLQGWRIDTIPLSKIQEIYLDEIYKSDRLTYKNYLEEILNQICEYYEIKIILENDDESLLKKGLKIEKILNKNKLDLLSFYILKLYGFNIEGDIFIQLKEIHEFLGEIEIEKNIEIDKFKDENKHQKQVLKKKEKKIKALEKVIDNNRKNIDDKYQKLCIEKTKNENEYCSQIKKLKQLLKVNEQEKKSLQKKCETEKLNFMHIEAKNKEKLKTEHSLYNSQILAFLIKNNYGITFSSFQQTEFSSNFENIPDEDILFFWNKTSDKVKIQFAKLVDNFQNDNINDNVLNLINLLIDDIKLEYIILRNLKALTLSYLSDKELEKNILS